MPRFEHFLLLLQHTPDTNTSGMSRMTCSGRSAMRFSAKLQIGDLWRNIMIFGTDSGFLGVGTHGRRENIIPVKPKPSPN